MLLFAIVVVAIIFARPHFRLVCIVECSLFDMFPLLRTVSLPLFLDPQRRSPESHKSIIDRKKLKNHTKKGHRHFFRDDGSTWHYTVNCSYDIWITVWCGVGML